MAYAVPCCEHFCASRAFSRAPISISLGAVLNVFNLGLCFIHLTFIKCPGKNHWQKAIVLFQNTGINSWRWEKYYLANVEYYRRLKDILSFSAI